MHSIALSTSSCMLKFEHNGISKQWCHFLATQIKVPSKDDWGKLKGVLRYLNGTKHLKLLLRADQLKVTVHWYVGGSHQTHKGCRGQSGALVTFGKGAVLSSSTVMKCNTKCTTRDGADYLGQ